MRPYQQPGWYHSNRYSADSACRHCGGIIRHERWCVHRNNAVSYAHAAAQNMAELSIEDKLILHALGVSWKADDGLQAALPSGKQCTGELLNCPEKRDV